MFAVKFNRAMAPYATGEVAAWRSETAPDYVRAIKGGYATRHVAEKQPAAPERKADDKAPASK